MKRTRLPLLCLVAYVAMGISFTAKAQYNPALLPDASYMIPYLWLNSGTNPNNAAFDYALQPVTTWGGPYEIKATAVDNNFPSTYSGLVYVDDNQGMGWYSFSIDQMTPGINVYPDVTICDNLNFLTYLYTNSFLIPIVFNDGGTIYMQLEQVFDAGGPWFGLLVTPSAPIQVSNTGVAIGAPHIDAESQYSKLTGWGSPTTDNVTITWAESSGAIQAWSGSINSITALYPSIPTTLIGSGLGTYRTIYLASSAPSNPDVAMVERKVGGMFHDVALFTFLENTVPMRLDYAEWDITSGLPVTVTVRDIGTFNAPRIDAIDDWQYNDPSMPRAFYTIVTTGTPTLPPIPSVWAYTNIRAIGVDVLGGVGLTGVKVDNATVACGPTSCSGSITAGQYGYTIQHWTTGAYATYLAEQLDWNTGLLASTNYYEVPMNPVTGSTDAISSPNNEDGSVSNAQYVYSSWDDGTYNVSTKLNQLCPFSFKNDKVKQQSKPITVKPLGNNAFHYYYADASEENSTWSASPNPATDYIALTAPQGASIDGKDEYSITDAVGREYLRSHVNNQVERINVSNYMPGLYLLHVYRNGVEEKTIKVVKE